MSPFSDLPAEAPEKPVAQVSLAGDGTVMVRASLVNADALLRTLGRPPREQVVTTRPAELDTLQALQLSNGDIVADVLARGAANLRKQHSDASAEQIIDAIYRKALSRTPTADELAIARSIVGEEVTDQSVADLLWVVLMLPEFQLIR